MACNSRRFSAGNQKGLCERLKSVGPAMEISKFKSQVSIKMEQVSAYFQKAENTLNALKGRTADRLQKVCCECEHGLRKIPGGSRDAIFFANGKISSFASQVSVSTKQILVHLRSCRNTVTILGRSVIERKILGGSRDAIFFASGKISSFASQVSVSTKQILVHLQSARNTFTTLGRSVIEKNRRLREARWAKEDELRNLLMDSSGAIVVTDSDRRLVEANPKALDLFGISEFNMSKFTIDTFLIHDRNPDFEGNGLPFRRPVERQGQCKIRRLDGGLLVAECIFVADVLPRRYLYKFLNAAPYRITLLGCAARKAGSATPRAESQPISVPNVTKQVNKLPRRGIRPVT